MTLSEVEIFTDGACSGNPGPGGWAAILQLGARERELSGGDPETTNNRMELMAAICGLEALKRPCRVRLFTDSLYVRDGVTIYTGVLGSLKRFKDDVKEVREGLECGMSVENYNDLKVGDRIESFKMEEVKRTLAGSAAAGA